MGATSIWINAVFYPQIVASCVSRGDSREFFLGPSMVYASGIIITSMTLEGLQNNELITVCEKLDRQPNDRVLVIGCRRGTLAAFAHKNRECDVLGISPSITKLLSGMRGRGRATEVPGGLVPSVVIVAICYGRGGSLLRL